MTDPADDTTGMTYHLLTTTGEVVSTAKPAADGSLTFEVPRADQKRRIKVVVGVLLRFVELRDLDDNDRKEADDLARAILAALDGDA